MSNVHQNSSIKHNSLHPSNLMEHGIYAGTSGYSYADWNRKSFFVANNTKKCTIQKPVSTDTLIWYQHYFSFVEINSTYHEMPEIADFLDIEKRSIPSMMYSVKVHKYAYPKGNINLDNGLILMRKHITSVSPLIETGRMYSFLLQLDGQLIRTLNGLEYLLALCTEVVKKRIDIHVEFRHISWHTRQVLQALKNSGIGICNTDYPLTKDGFPLKSYATTDKGYMRYSGRNFATWNAKPEFATYAEKRAASNARYNYYYSNNELDELVSGQKTVLTKASKIAIVYNNHYNGYSLKNASENIHLLKKSLTPTANASSPVPLCSAPVFPSVSSGFRDGE